MSRSGRLKRRLAWEKFEASAAVPKAQRKMERTAGQHQHHIVVTEDGPPCPRCRRPMQVREHAQITDKHLRQPWYFARWYFCRHRDCQTWQVMQEE